MILSDDEMLKLWKETPNPSGGVLFYLRLIAQAQHKKDVEWLEGECTDHEYVCSRRDCPECWIEFKKEGK